MAALKVCFPVVLSDFLFPRWSARSGLGSHTLTSHCPRPKQGPWTLGGRWGHCLHQLCSISCVAENIPAGKVSTALGSNSHSVSNSYGLPPSQGCTTLDSCKGLCLPLPAETVPASPQNSAHGGFWFPGLGSPGARHLVLGSVVCDPSDLG